MGCEQPAGRDQVAGLLGSRGSKEGSVRITPGRIFGVVAWWSVTGNYLSYTPEEEMTARTRVTGRAVPQRARHAGPPKVQFTATAHQNPGFLENSALPDLSPEM